MIVPTSQDACADYMTCESSEGMLNKLVSGVKQFRMATNLAFASYYQNPTPFTT